MELSLEDIKTAIKEDLPKPLYIRDTVGWSMNIKANDRAFRYLIENNCMEAYEQYPNRFWYDRVRDRVVFTEYDTQNSFKLATGRSLCGAAPKWFKYVALPGEYFIAEYVGVRDGKQTPTVIVEDCASACSVSRVANGLALCGTNYNTFAITQKLKDAKDVIVCLDPDAQLQALKLQRDLMGLGTFRSVKVVLCKDDPKYLSKNELFELLYKGEEYDKEE